MRVRPRAQTPAASHQQTGDRISMTNQDRIVLVAGATGRQGGAVVRHMLPKGWRLRALTRKPKSYAARQLAEKGVELAEGDMDDPASLERAARGVYGIYSVQDSWTVGARREVQQGKNLADAARKAGLEHLVYSSAGGANLNSGVTHFETKWVVEKHIRSLNLPATVLRTSAFMETYHILEVEVGLLKGKLADPIRGDKPYQTIATDDIGGFVALAFERPKEFIGLELEIAGSELTNPEAAQVFSRVLGKPVKFQKLPMMMVRLVLGKEFYQMFRWFNEEGFKADIAELRRRYPEVRLQTLEEWLRSEGWQKRARHLEPP